MQSPDIISAEILKEYSLKLIFTNGETKIFDMKSYLKYPIFKPLNNENEFKMFSIVDGTIEWNCDAELSVDTFYLGSKKYNKEELKEMWSLQPVTKGSDTQLKNGNQYNKYRKALLLKNCSIFI